MFTCQFFFFFFNVHDNQTLVYPLKIMKYWLVKLPARFRCKSYGVVCHGNPNNGLENRHWDSKKHGWQCESPSWVKEEVSMLVKYRKPCNGQ